MTTILGSFQPYPPTPGAGTSCPGTPLSGVSTVAIKDGHEGIRHGHHHGGDPAAQERMARLGAYGGTYLATGSLGEDGGGYFERVAGWRDSDEAGEPPEEQQGVSRGELIGERSGPSNDTPKDLNTSSLAGKLADKLTPKGQLSMPPRWSPSSYPTKIPNPPCPTPATPFSIARNPLSQVPSTHPGPNNNNSNNNARSSSNTSTPTSVTGLCTPSPASTLTTNSVREAKHHARMLGPMTYDEGVVDTTSQNGSETTGSPGQPNVLNQEDILAGEPMYLDERVEESRKERVEDIEERIVGGEHGAFRD